MVGVSVWRKLVYSLIWQSVMWRPGKLRFLIGVKNPLPNGRPRPPDNTAPAGPRRSPDSRLQSGYALPSATHPATLSHPDRRALLILFVAHHMSSFTGHRSRELRLTSSIRAPFWSRSNMMR